MKFNATACSFTGSDSNLPARLCAFSDEEMVTELRAQAEEFITTIKNKLTPIK